MLDNSGDVIEESTSCVLKSAPFSCHAEWLTGKTSDKQIEIGHSCCVNSCNVAIINLSLRVINGFVSGSSVLVDLAVPDTFKASRLLETASKTADSRKAVEKFNCYKITPLHFFASIFTSTFSVHYPVLPSAL